MNQQVNYSFVLVAIVLVFSISFCSSSYSISINSKDNINSINLIKEESSTNDRQLNSNSNDNSNQFYPIELDAKCEPLEMENNICTKYLSYNRIYTSKTQVDQRTAATSASLYIDQIIQFGSQQCSQEIVFKTVCTYLFPQCLTYIESDGDKEFNIAVRTCYDECYQSVEWCSAYSFDCDQSLNGYSNIPMFPNNSTKYNFQEYGYQNVYLQCENPFMSSSSNSNDNSNNINPSSSSKETPTPTPTPLQPIEPHHSNFIKFIISFAIIFPIVSIIALIIYNFNRGKLTKKKLSSIEYQDDEYQHTNNNNNNITPTGNSIVNEYTPLMGH